MADSAPSRPVAPEPVHLDEIQEAVPPEPTPKITSKIAPASRTAAAPNAPPAAAPATTASAAPAAAARKRGWKRPVLFALLPIALVVGGYEYVTGGAVMSTENAYVQAPTLGVSTDVSGTVIDIPVRDNQRVRKGDVLFRLRPDSFQIALDGAKAQLGTVRNQVLTLKASYLQAQAEITQAQADLPYYQETVRRQQNLFSTATGAKATLDQAQHDLIAAQQKVTVAKAQADAMLAQLGGDPDEKVEDNPFYRQAQSAVDNAERDLRDTMVKAPFDGIVTNVDALQVGHYLQAATPGFSLVATDRVWVEASPKETELTYVRPGQAATVTVDTYPGVEWHGTVDTISPASGSSFSLLPAQNTTGNWVKVVQRIPMRVRITDAAGKPPLRVGMSVEVDVDTGHARGLPTFVEHLFGTRKAVAADGASEGAGDEASHG